MIHLTSPPITLEDSSHHFQPTSPLQPVQKNTQDSAITKPDNSLDFSSVKAQSSFNRDLHEANPQRPQKILEIPLGEPTKKLKIDQSATNTTSEKMEVISPLPSTSAPQRQTIIVPVATKVSPTVNQKISSSQGSDKEIRESFSTNTSSSYQPVFLLEKDMSNFDDQEDDSFYYPTGYSTEPLFVVDEVTLDFQRAKEQVMKQLMIKSVANQVEIPVQRPQTNSNMMSWMSLQAGQVNQRNLFNKDLYTNQMLNPLLSSLNSVLLPNLVNNIKLAHIARQAKLQFQPNGYQSSSLLGKRENPYENLELLRDEFIRNRLVEIVNSKQPDIIVLDDEKETIKKPDPYANWTFNPNKKTFKIERIVRTKPVKKQIFKIIRTRPKTKFRPKPLISKLTIARKIIPLIKKDPFKLIQQKNHVSEGNKENKAISLTAVLMQEKEGNISRKSSFDSRKNELKENQFDTPPRRKESRKFDDDEDYEINLHAKDEDDDENIVLTPVGEEFQMRIKPFVKPNARKRKLRVLWDPEKIEEKAVNDYFKEVEVRFEKPIVNQALALKLFRECGMDVEKVVEILENNKVYKRDFFEVRQKVLRNRMLHHEILQ